MWAYHAGATIPSEIEDKRLENRKSDIGERPWEGFIPNGLETQSLWAEVPCEMI